MEPDDAAASGRCAPHTANGRCARSRSQAALGCSGGHGKGRGKSVKANHLVRVGDPLEVRRGERLFVLDVVALAEKRLSAPLARELYTDRSPPPPPREQRDRAGRPSKRDRRLLRRLRGRGS